MADITTLAPKTDSAQHDSGIPRIITPLTKKDAMLRALRMHQERVEQRGWQHTESEEIGPEGDHLNQRAGLSVQTGLHFEHQTQYFEHRRQFYEHHRQLQEDRQHRHRHHHIASVVHRLKERLLTMSR